MLLVLDNLEQLLPEAGDVIESLLAQCSGLTIMVTSRVRLQIDGEHVVETKPLTLPHQIEPSMEAVRASPAVQLFVERSRAAGASVSLDRDQLLLASKICHRLDGLPLAIELAAGWTRLYALDALIERLDKPLSLLTRRGVAPLHRRSMRDAIAWSFDLLTAEQKRLFAQTAVFEGGFRLEAACHVNGNADHEAVLGILVDLVDRSLLVSGVAFDGNPRFSMLETIREFGLEQLDASTDAERTVQRHLEWFTARAATLGAANRWEPQVIEQLATERANLEAALRQSLATNNLESAEVLISGLGRYWLDGGSIREAQRWLEYIFEASPDPPNVRLRGRTMRQLGIVFWYQGNVDEAEYWLNRSRDVHQSLDDRYEVARDQNYLASVAEARGDIDLAIRHFRDAHAVFAACGDDAFAALMLEGIADMNYRRGHLAEAEAQVIEASAMARRSANPIILGVVLGGLAQLRLEIGDLDGGWSALDECLTLYDLDPSPTRLSDTLAGYARAAERTGDAALAAVLLGKVDAIVETMGAVRVEHFEQHARAFAATRNAIPRAAFDAAFERGRGLSDDDAKELARDHSTRRSSPVGRNRKPASLPNALTSREYDVLRLLAEGQSNREIAEALGLRYRTVTSHVSSILSKLDAPSRTSALAVAMRRGLLTASPDD
jgi:non-specific serine/threonine protein kinase